MNDDEGMLVRIVSALFRDQGLELTRVGCPTAASEFKMHDYPYSVLLCLFYLFVPFHYWVAATAMP